MNNTKHKLAAASPEKQLAALIQNLDRWLGGIYSNLKKKDQELLRLSVDHPQLRELIQKNDKLIDFLDDQVESLDVLKNPKPGMLASIVDFMYTMVVDTSHQSDKQRYMEKLKQLKQDKWSRSREPNKEDSDKVRQILDLVFKGLKENQKIAQIKMALETSIYQMVDWEQDSSLLKGGLDQIDQILQKNLPENYRSIYQRLVPKLEDFLKQKIEEQKELASVDKNKKRIQLEQLLTQARSRQDRAQQSVKSFFEGFRVVKADEQQYVKVLREYDQILESMSSMLKNQSNNYIQQLNQILKDLPEKTSKETTFVVKRYREYILGLFDLNRVDSLADQIVELKNYFDKQFKDDIDHPEDQTNKPAGQ